MRCRRNKSAKKPPTVIDPGASRIPHRNSEAPEPPLGRGLRHVQGETDRMGWRVCSTPGCGEIHDGTGRCPDCRHQADATRTSGAAKYGNAHRTRFRPGVLAKNDGRCTCEGCTGHDGDCTAGATVADHHPLDRDELVRRGLDPDDPTHGRGLCTSCHNRWTASTKPAGFRG
jgi:5-methylcytosine-specific restriction enzyme A